MISRRILAALLAGALTASCAISEDATPVEIPPDQRGLFGAQPTGDVAAGNNRVFLVNSASGGKLRSVLRAGSSDAEGIFKSLFAGPNEAEADSGLSTFLPEGIELNNARVRVRSLTLDVNDVFDELTAVALRTAVAQIVATASEIDGVEQVRIQIDGENQVWPVGDGENTDRRLTVYDYPGFIESSQPAYPAIPSANN
ncbi:MAG: spore germination protein GerM [Ilumatobacter sp.]|jgi:spore germination protein GerM